MNDYIIRATAANDQIRAFAAVTTEMVETAREHHNTSPVATAALGRLLTAGAMMGSMMKGEKDVLTLQIKAGGPLQGITVTADSQGNVKGYVGNPDVCIPANSKGKLDVAGAVGPGFLTVIKDMGLKEPYSGQVMLQTCEIAEDLTYYFATSEQVPSAVGLGVLMNKNNTVRQAGGFIGYNNEGLIENNEMYLADTIRGTSNQIGPFSGTTSLNSSYDFNTKKNIEGKDNTYRIYRTRSDSLIDIIKNSSLYSKKDSDFDNWNVFKISHYDKVQKYDDLKDAKLANETESETVDLNAYVSPAKAVLMDDTEVSDNEDGTTPVPSDTQDPCNEKVNITINKLWKDLSDKQKERPDTITVTLTRTYMKGSDEISEKVGDYTLSTNDVTDSKNTWQTIIKGLDAYTTLDDGSKAYYTYSVTESEVENYITSIEESDDGYTFTITNKDMPLLPNLGGKGTMLFVLVGIVGVLAVLLSYKKSKKANNIKE